MKNRIVKLLALLLVLTLVLSGCSMITVDQEKLNAQTAAVVGGEIITRGEAMPVYVNYVNYQALNYYYNYGISDISSMLDSYRNIVLDDLVEKRLLAQKAKEPGLDQLNEEELADVNSKAEAQFEDYITNYQDTVTKEGMSDEEIRTATIAYLESNGLTMDDLIHEYTTKAINDKVHAEVVKDVTVSDEDLQAAFDKEVATDESSFSSSAYLYEYYKTNGATVYWNPEGYRTVKHILLMLSDEQKNELSTLESELADINTQIAALETAAEQTSEEKTEENSEETAPAKTLDELNAEKAEKEKAIEDKKSELLASFSEKTTAIAERYQAGETFDALMAEFGEDPGMQREPGMTDGYVVSAASVLWEAAFTEHAMALEKIGDLSDPFLGSNGVHIICYTGDVTPGAIALDAVREEIQASTLSSLQSEVYSKTIQEWRAAANVKTYPNVLSDD